MRSKCKIIVQRKSFLHLLIGIKNGNRACSCYFSIKGNRDHFVARQIDGMLFGSKQPYMKFRLGPFYENDFY